MIGIGIFIVLAAVFAMAALVVIAMRGIGAIKFSWSGVLPIVIVLFLVAFACLWIAGEISASV
jgi:hypothetical protein